MSSLALRTAAIMEAAMTSDEAKRSLTCRWRSSCAMAINMTGAGDGANQNMTLR